jgi:ribose/xylose/arabinose/galactoside ABC-type transport system permease subunit
MATKAAILPRANRLNSLVTSLRRREHNYVATLALVDLAALVVLTLTTHGFLSTINVKTCCVDVAIDIGPAVGLTMVLLTGGIDVSIGSVMAVDAAVVGIMFEHGAPLWLGMLVGLAGGAGAGALNAALVVLTKVPPIVATLATSQIWLAVSFVLIGSNWITAVPLSLTQVVAVDSIGPVPWSLLVMLLVMGIVAYFLRHRRLGRVIYAIGNNEEAARTAGLSIVWGKLVVYVVLGLLTGIGMVLLIGQSPVVNEQTGSGVLLPVLAAVVVGGTSITGGRGSVLGSFLGVVLVELVNDAVILYHINPFWDDAVLGGIILVAVVAGFAGGDKSAIGGGKL